MQNTNTYAALAVAVALGLAGAATPASAQWYHGGMRGFAHWGGFHGGYGGWRVAGGWHRPWGYGYRRWSGYGVGGLGYAHYGCGYGCGGYGAYTYAVPEMSYVPTYEITTSYVPAVTGYSYGMSGCGCGW